MQNPRITNRKPGREKPRLHAQRRGYHSAMPAARVIVADFVSEPLDDERRVLGDLAAVSALDAFSEDDLIGRIEDADAIMIYHQFNLTRRVIDRLTKCKLIVRCGVGFDNVDHAFARSRGIAVANIPDYGTEDVADTAIGMMLSLTRGTHLLNSRLRRGEGAWHFSQAAPLHRVRGRVFGIIGLGRIGTAAALRAKALGMDVIFHDPYVPDGKDKSLGVRRAETLADLLRQAHVLSVHAPLTEETRRMVNDETLTLLPRGACLINTARGAIVDPSAVLRAIESGQLASAGIDVLETEPPPAGDPVIAAWRDPRHPAHDRIILNPHAAFYTEEGLRDMRVKGSENVRRVLLGIPPRNVVN
jgi:D-3-phosphoglycerate dehydrogenase/C-terminal binding protein